MGVASSIPFDINIETNYYPEIHRWKLQDGKKKVCFINAQFEVLFISCICMYMLIIGVMLGRC
jgi:hypothetical protein